MRIFRYSLVVIILSLITIFTFAQSIKTGIDALPEWSKVVFSVNIKKALADPEVKKILKEDDNFQKAHKELKNVGIDITKDFNTLSVGLAEFNFKQPDKVPNFVVVLEGRYNETKLLNFIKKKAKKEGNKKLVEKKIGNYTVLSEKNNNDFQVALVKGRAILVTIPGQMKEAINVVEGKGKSIPKSSQLYSLAHSFQKKRSLVWGVAQFTSDMQNFFAEQINSPNVENNPIMTNVVNAFSKLKFVNFSVDQNGSSSKILAGGISENEESAGDLELLFTQFKGMAGMVLPAEIVKKIKVSKSGTKASIDVTLSKADIKKLQKMGEEKSSPPSPRTEPESGGR